MKKLPAKPLGLAVLAVTVIAAAALIATNLPGARAADKPAADKPAATAKPALTVTVVQAQAGQLSQSVRANGTIAAWQEAIVGAEANGWRLAEVRVNVGDRVR